MKQTKSAGLLISYPSTQNPFEFSCFWPAYDQFRVPKLQNTKDLQALLNLGYRPLKTILQGLSGVMHDYKTIYLSFQSS